MAIGVLNYPDLDWRFVGGDLHTVPVGYGPDGKPKVVMDILLFDQMTGAQSIAFTTRKPVCRITGAKARRQWTTLMRFS
jgi:hypothetical protein